MADKSTDNEMFEERSNLDATGEFFSVGATLHAVRAGYIQRRADEQLKDAVSAGRYAHVLAPDRSGKSSLIAATAARIESKACKVAILDLAQLSDRDGGTDAGRWYYSVAYRLLRQLRIRYDLQSWWQDKSILSNRQRLFEFYSEVILQNVPERIVIFVDEIQCIEELDYADQLLISIRAAHNARTTDPDFSRLCFVLLGECDPLSLMQEAEASPFNVTQQIVLDDFNRDDLNLFATELNRGQEDAAVALDRIFHWTHGQPYLTQKLARAVAREPSADNVEELVDRVALNQLAGRAALHSEPHMSHIHRTVVNDKKRAEALLNLYGKIRKGIDVPADLGSAFQRRLMAVGLLVIDEESNVRVRNRLFEEVFTARWANDNLPTRYKVPSLAAAIVLLIVLIPFWYTQWLPGPYVRALASDDVEVSVAIEAYENFRSFPGHSQTANDIFRSFLERRALTSDDAAEVEQLAMLASDLPSAGRLAEEIEAGFWDRKMSQAVRQEDRDAALMAGIHALVLPTPLRRQRAAALLSNDYPHLLRTFPGHTAATAVFDPAGMTLTAVVDAAISQYSYTPQGVQQREPWSITALEVSPLVRRVIVDREGTVRRIGLTLTLSHARLADLRIKIIAPSGRTVEIDTPVESASSNDEIRIPDSQFRDLKGEALSGTWSISLRDENLGVAGQLVGWNLKLNSQGAVEHFQRGLNIPDPVEAETDDIWFDRSGRYAVARATQSDSVRIWDLSFAEPVRAIALPEGEILIGLDASARRLVTATQDTVNIWDTATGDRIDKLAIGGASSVAVLTADGGNLFVQRRSDAETRLELWSLDKATRSSEIVVAGAPALVAIDAAGRRVAVADFDRAIRIWDMTTAQMLGQFDLPAQPGEISLSADGSALAAVYPNVGISLWGIDDPLHPLLTDIGSGDWQLSFSPSGNLLAAGRPKSGFQVYNTADGRRIGPALGVRERGAIPDFLSFSDDEQVLLTGSIDSGPRIWRVPNFNSADDENRQLAEHMIWSPSADRALAVPPDGSYIAVGDLVGHVHFFSATSTVEELAKTSDDISFVGHSGEVQHLETDSSGLLVASVAGDNSIRLWRSTTGEPLPFVVEIDGPPVSELAFSGNSEFLGVIHGTQVSIVSTTNGTLLKRFDSNAALTDLAFVNSVELYIGDRDGALHLLSRLGDGDWSAQQVWQGQQGIRVLQASPRGDVMVLVDDLGNASQFLLAESRIGDATLQLPSGVREITFDRNGTRVYFRTERWVHRVNSSRIGLTWSDAVFVQRPLNGADLVHGNGDPDLAVGRKLFMLVADNGFIGFTDIDFGGVGSAGLFGSYEDLLLEWRERVNAYRPEGS